MTNEADTCRKFVVPKLQTADWDTDPHSIAEERTFADGRIYPLPDGRARRGKPRRADYILRYTRDLSLAVVAGAQDDSNVQTRSWTPFRTHPRAFAPSSGLFLS